MTDTPIGKMPSFSNIARKGTGLSKQNKIGVEIIGSNKDVVVATLLDTAGNTVYFAEDINDTKSIVYDVERDIERLVEIKSKLSVDFYISTFALLLSLFLSISSFFQFFYNKILILNWGDYDFYGTVFFALVFFICLFLSNDLFFMKKRIDVFLRTHKNNLVKLKRSK